MKKACLVILVITGFFLGVQAQENDAKRDTAYFIQRPQGTPLSEEVVYDLTLSDIFGKPFITITSDTSAYVIVYHGNVVESGVVKSGRITKNVSSGHSSGNAFGSSTLWVHTYYFLVAYPDASVRLITSKPKDGIYYVTENGELDSFDNNWAVVRMVLEP
jgi:hypothetical protein